jgi:Tat protein secretion system quality control protein TatD with DNase activity
LKLKIRKLRGEEMKRFRENFLIDAHAHLGIDWKYGFELTPQELIKKMKKAGVDKTIIFPCPWTKSFDYVEENRYIIRASRRYKNLFPGLIVNPLIRKSLEEIQSLCKQEKVRAIKLHPSAGNYSLREAVLNAFVFDFIEDLALPLFIHSSYKPKNEEILEIAQRFSGPVIVSHAFRFNKNLVRKATQLSNVYLDLSPFLTLLNAGQESKIILGNPEELIESARKRNPKHLFKVLFEMMKGRIIWGTDEPWCSKLPFSVGYFKEVNFIKHLNEKLREKIMMNAQEIFSL